MHIIWVILIGFVIGAIAKLLMPGKDPGGFFMTSLLGIGGSWVGGWLAGMLGMNPNVGLVGSVIGAMIILAVYRMMTKK
jgi:uncharacterized membrane protein YeaQ/YmgE (transglycosylase-associated protein family)